MSTITSVVQRRIPTYIVYCQQLCFKTEFKRLNLINCFQTDEIRSLVCHAFFNFAGGFSILFRYGNFCPSSHLLFLILRTFGGKFARFASIDKLLALRGNPPYPVPWRGNQDEIYVIQIKFVPNLPYARSGHYFH